MDDYSNEYTCRLISKCQACAPSELNQPFCKLNGYKQEVACEWNGTVPKDYQDSHYLPEYQECAHPEEKDRRDFFRNEFLFIVLGIAAFAVYVWRKKRIGYSRV
ncbi:hypothetical protein EC988_003087 [Linderina pennispora]|nr:hypothetical protein EC988_003087 [Linderina pennispora]